MRRSVTAMAWSFCMVGMPALAQPDRGADPSQIVNTTEAGSSTAGSMEVAAHLWGVIGRYRFAATADLVRVTLVRPGGRSDMHSMEVRCVPGSSGLARLELGDLSVEARQGVLRAVHRRDPTTYVKVTPDIPAGEGELKKDPASVLRAVLPPLPIPHLSLAFDAAEVDWCPLVTGLVWERAERLEDGPRDGVRLVGRTDTGTASLEIAGARVRRFEADLEPTGRTRIIIECEPLEPSDPDSWVLDVQGRRLVAGLGSLAPLGPATEVGESLPRLSVQGIDGQSAPVLPESAEHTFGSERTFRVVLFLRNSTPPEFVREAAGKLAEAYTTVSRDVLRGRLDGTYDKRLRLAGLTALVEVTTDSTVLERLRTEARVWDDATSAMPQGIAGGKAIGSFVSGDRMVDRLAFTAEAAMVMIDDNRKIRAILPIDERTLQDAMRQTLLDTIASSD